MSEYVTDPELLAQLNGASREEKPQEEYVEDSAVLAELNKGAGEGYVDDPELLKQLNASAKGPVAPEGPGVLGAVAPAVTGYGAGPTGYSGSAVKQVLDPLKGAVPQTLQTYKAAPWKAGVDMAVGSIGLPPPYATVEGAKGAVKGYQAGKESFTEASRLASQFSDRSDVGKYQDLWKAVKKVDPGTEKIISDIYHNRGGGNAVQNWLTSSPEGKKFLADPRTAQIAEQYLGAMPSKGAQAMKVISPVLKGAARVAGPLGMAANLYEAAPYLEQAGPEASSGRAQNRMAEAQRMMLSRPTPMPLSPQEANNLLQSDDARTINIYGGRANLEALVKSGLRQKAASRVLGPVAPGQQ